MLAWEESMYNDLTPLFKRVPPVHARPTGPTPTIEDPIGTSTASSSPAATSTPAATTTAIEAPQFFQGNFLDQIVENHDARVMLSQDGDILLLWTFLDRSTIVVTTNEATLREIISRLSQPSVISLPPGK
jgi:hypothetical protein